MNTSSFLWEVFLWSLEYHKSLTVFPPLWRFIFLTIPITPIHSKISNSSRCVPYYMLSHSTLFSHELLSISKEWITICTTQFIYLCPFLAAHLFTHVANCSPRKWCWWTKEYWFPLEGKRIMIFCEYILADTFIVLVLINSKFPSRPNSNSKWSVINFLVSYFFISYSNQVSLCNYFYCCT